MPWITKKKLKQLENRLQAVEEATKMVEAPYAYYRNSYTVKEYGIPVTEVLQELLDHLNIKLVRQSAKVIIEK